MKMPHRAGLCLAATLTVLSPAPREARADDARAAAQALFDEAMKQMEARAYDRACPKLEEAVKLLPGKVGTMMELARCYEDWGKTASAWSRYRAAADAAAAASDPRAAKARAKTDELAPRVPKLILEVAPANQSLRGFTLERDGHEIGTAEWGAALPADPGKHAVAASAPGKKRWTATLSIAPGATPTTLRIPGLEDDPAAPAPPRPADAAPPASASAPLWPWVAGGIGIASLGFAIGFGVDGLMAKRSLDQLCHGTLSPCAGHTASDIDPLNARKDRGLALFIGFGTAGAAGLSAGIVGLVSHRKPVDALVVAPLVGPGFAGAVLGNRF
jgi:hypothetical protein